MEIIDELEPVKRGVCSTVGYVSWAGEMDTAIALEPRWSWIRRW